MLLPIISSLWNSKFFGQSRDQRSTSTLYFWTIIILASSGFIFFKYFASFIVLDWYHRGQWDLLNWWSASASHQSIEFYVGRIEEVLWGPMAQVFSALVLIMLVHRYLKDSSPGVYTLAILVYLIIVKWDVLFFPLYGDAIGGPFTEAFWLYEHHFDYQGLFHQPSYDQGGARVYLFSIYPTFLALSLKLMTKPVIFLFIQHLLVFIMTAAIIGSLRECFLKVFDKDLSALAAMIFLFTPLVQSQSEAVNMEIPSALFMMWAAQGLIEKQFEKAVLYSVISALIKGSGVFACAVSAVFILFNFITVQDHKQKIWRCFEILILILTAIGLVSLKFVFKDVHINEGMVHWAAGWPSLSKEFIFYLFWGCILVVGYYSWKNRLLPQEKKREGWRDERVFAVMAGMAGMWFFLFFNFYAVSPRYRVALYPFLIFIVVYAVFKIISHSSTRLKLTIVLSLILMWFSYGQFYGTMTENDHVLLERSLEYRNDLKVNQKMAKAIEARYSSLIIVAPFIRAQSLAIPQLGYISHPLHVMIYGFNLRSDRIIKFPGLANFNSEKAVFVGEKIAPLPDNFPYPMGPKDLLIENIQVGNKSLPIFMGGFYIDALWRISHLLPKG